MGTRYDFARPVRIEHVADFAEKLRTSDVEELKASINAAPLDALWLSLRASVEAWEGVTRSGELICMFGVGVINQAAGIGSPWMLGTDGIERHWVEFLRGSVTWISDVRTRYARLVNYVDARNEDSIRWLEWLGFEIFPPEPYGVEGRAFHRFEMRGEPCASQC